jgi:hypothetical protein
MFGSMGHGRGMRRVVIRDGVQARHVLIVRLEVPPGLHHVVRIPQDRRGHLLWRPQERKRGDREPVDLGGAA